MTTLALITPIDPGTGSRVTLRVCSANDSQAASASGETWWPAIVEEPTVSLSLFDGDFSSAVEPGNASIALRLDVLREARRVTSLFPRVERYDWAGAKVVLYRLVSGAPVDLAVMRVDSFSLEADVVALSLVVDSEWAEADVLFNEYAGTTGVEGSADLKGQPKPWVFGRALNVEPVFIDQIDNVFQVSGYGPVSAIPAVYERGSSFGASVGDFATYAALVAATIPAGRWGTCLAQGLFRLGAPPAGVITCDVDGDSTSGFLRRTGAIISEVARRLGVSAMVNADSLTALDAAVPRNVNIVISEQVSLIDLARAMVAPCNAVAGLGLDGRLIAPRVAFGSEVLTLDAQGRQLPPVLNMARQNTRPPYKRIKMGGSRSWRVHSFDEIAFFAELIDRGLYAAATVYREGNIVESADKSRWVYVNPTASSGNAPPTWPTASNAFWSNIAPPISEVGGVPVAQLLADVEQALTNASAAITSAATAQATADGKVTTYFQNEPPVADAVGDLWIDTNDGNRLYRWSGSAWVEIRDAGIAQAITNAATAQSTADGKIVTFYQAAPPTAGAVGDLWIDTDDSNKLYRWSGSAWVAARDAGIALAQQQAADAAAAAAAAQTSANTANTAISNITADNILSRDEKPEIRKQRDAIIGEYPTIRARGVALGVAVGNYDADYTALINYLGGLDLGSATDTAITRTTFNTFFTDYYAERQTVLDGIADEASKRASGLPLGNANRVPFSRFEGGRGWATNGTFAPTPFPITVEGLVYIAAEWTNTAASQNVFLFSNPLFPVNPGERLSVSIQAEAFATAGGPHPNFWQIYIEYYDGAGALGPGSTQVAAGTGALYSNVRHAVFSTVPTGARFARLVMRNESAGAGAMKSTLLHPMITSAAGNQTVHPPFTPGPNASDGADPNNLITIDAGSGIISGIGTANIPVDNRRLPLGGNAVVNSDFTRGKFGWRAGNGTTDAQWGVNLPGWFGQRNVMWMTAPGAFAINAVRDISPNALWEGGGLPNAPLFAMPVIAGDRLAASVLAAQHRCTMQLYVLIFDGASTLISAPVVGGALPGGAGNGDPASFTRLTVFADVPANGRWAIPMMRLLGTGESDPYIFFTEPMLSKIAAGQVTAPPYSPGRADALADETTSALRTIEPQFPVIEIKQGEAGNSGTRSVTHVAKRGGATITGGTWSIISTNVPGSTITVDAGTGTVSLSGVAVSGAYVIRYTHTDGIATDLPVNVTYVPTPVGVVSAKTGATSNLAGFQNSWGTIISLQLLNCPAGRLFFNKGFDGGSVIFPQTGTGDASHRCRLLINGSVVQTTTAKSTVSGGAIQFADFSELFDSPRTVPAGTVTVAIQSERTSGTGTVDSSNNVIDASVIAS